MGLTSQFLTRIYKNNANRTQNQVYLSYVEVKLILSKNNAKRE